MRRFHKRQYIKLPRHHKALKLRGKQPIKSSVKLRPTFIYLLLPLLSGCIGFNFPQPYENKPFTFIKGGDQLGRDQLTNRYLVASKKVKVTGWDKNDVLSLLGQPQQIQIRERNVSEDWYFVYYKKYISYNPANKISFPDEEGEFVLHVYQDKVISTTNL